MAETSERELMASRTAAAVSASGQIPPPPDPEGRELASRPDLARITLGVLLLVGLIAASFWILQPFLLAVVWATMIVVSTWPMMLRLQAWLWRRRAPAVVVMTLGLLLIFLVPLSLALIAITGNAGRFVSWAQSLASLTLPPPPVWLADVPLLGPRAVELWSHAAATGFEGLSAKAAPYAGVVTRWLLAQIGTLGTVLLQFLLTVIFAAIMYARGERGVDGMVRFGRRLAGDRGEASVRLAGHAIRGVAMGVVVTAIVQTGLGCIGLAVSGVPFAALLTAVMFMLCIAQLGPGLVLFPAVIWLYWGGDTLWGTILLVWSIFAGTIDNLLRPILIKRSADLPLLLIFLGVIGGLIAFGLVGIFVGPVVLAVAYTLLQAWVNEEPRLAR
jgi:predicted PurR-regulated permease PerM